MVDTISKEKRHEVMSKIRSKDTKIEIKVRHWLYHHGIRYRKNCMDIPGKPDVAIKKYKIAIFLHGCFWHGHENCKLFKLPKSNTEFWEDKIDKNIIRDQKITEELQKNGWHVFILWECALNTNFEQVMESIYEKIMEIKGEHNLKRNR